jgi:hypothetical protein
MGDYFVLNGGPINLFALVYFSQNPPLRNQVIPTLIPFVIIDDPLYRPMKKIIFSPNFPFLDSPYCKPDQVQVFGVAREETVRISCEVVSNPVGSTTFEWRFNASGEMVDMPHDRFRSTNSKVRH